MNIYAVNSIRKTNEFSRTKNVFLLIDDFIYADYQLKQIIYIVDHTR